VPNPFCTEGIRSVFIVRCATVLITSTLNRKSKLPVSISADFPEWEPSVLDEHELIFMYEMRAIKGILGTYRAQRN